MASGIYDNFKGNLFLGNVDMDTDVIKVILLNNSHSFTSTNDDYSDILANELASGSGYTTAGETLTNASVVSTTSTAKWDADNVAWTSATFTAAHAVIHDTTIVGANDLVCSIDFGGDKSVAAGTFTLQWNASGIITIAG